jgi:predicted transcriptional regulator
MQRITISLPDNVAAALKREARRQKSSSSQVAREAIEARLNIGQKRALSFIGMIKSGRTDIAANFDEYLEAARATDPNLDRRS